MKTLVISLFGYDEGKSGISKYMDHVVKRLKREYKVEILIPDNQIQYLDQSIYKGLTIHSFYLKSKLTEVIFHSIILPFYLFFKFPNQRIFLPALNRRLFFFKTKNTIGTLHDLSQYHVTKKYDIFRMFYIKRIIPKFLNGLDKIMTPSKSTLDDLLKYTDIKKNKIIVNHNGLNNKPSEEKLIFERRTFQILYVSRLEWPGKNHQVIIEAVKKLVENNSKNIKVSFVGSNWGGKDPIEKMIKENNLEKYIEIREHLSKSELEEAYAESDLFIHPSLYEGFGLPLLEAMSYGLPCISSNKSSLPEIGGEAVLYFDPKNSNQLVDQISKLLSSKNLRKDLSVKSIKRSRKFSWDNHVQKIIELFQQQEHA